MAKKAEDVLKEWLSAVNAGDLEGVLALYNEKAVLIPTFSNNLPDNPVKIRDYFETLASRKGLGVALHERTLNVQPITDDICALSGIYCWRFMLDEEMMNFEARFSYLLDLGQARPIMQHHSSQLPRTL